MPEKIAIYDMDRTITVRATYTPFLIYMMRRRAPWRFCLLPLVGLALLAYTLKMIDRARLKTWNQRLCLGGALHPDELAPDIAAFAEKMMQTNVSPGALEQIEADRKAGNILIMATASYELYVTAIAERLGFDHVLATRLHRNEAGYIVPRIIGENCYDLAKLDRIEEFFAAQNWDRAKTTVRAYSDHVSDAPMLEFADVAVATNAHPPLRRLAGDRNWQIREWNTAASRA